MTHDEFKDLVPVFALDSLPPGDEAELVAHLKICRECSDLLALHRETAGMLAFAAPSRQAPGDLKDRILRDAARTAPVQPSRPLAKVTARKPAVDWSWRWQRAGLVAACVLALVAGGLGFLRLDSQTDRLTRQQQVIAQQRDALDLIGSPNSIVLSMAPTDGSAGATGKAFVSEEKGSAAVVVSGLAAPGDDVYTLWLIAEGKPKPVTDFLPEDGLALLPVNEPVGSDATLAVTREPNRGNSKPQGPVILAAYRA